MPANVLSAVLPHFNSWLVSHISTIIIQSRAASSEEYLHRFIFCVHGVFRGVTGMEPDVALRLVKFEVVGGCIGWND